MELSIIHRVAQMVVSNKVDQALGLKESVAPKRALRDQVSISGTASDAKTVAAKLAASPEREPERAEKVEQVKKLVMQKKYVLSPEMVDSIAERIARTLI